MKKQFQFTQSDIDECKSRALNWYDRLKDYEEDEELAVLLEKNFGDDAEAVFGFFIWYFTKQDMKA